MPTKNRDKITPGTTKNVTFVCDSPDPLPDPPISYPPYSRDLISSAYVELKEKIWDESWNGDRKTWKNFEHYKLSSTKPLDVDQPFKDKASFSPYSYSTSCNLKTARWQLWAAGSYSMPFGDAGAPINGLPAFDQPNQLDGTFVPRPADLDNLNDRALKHMLPKIKEDLSLINSVIELKDFRSLPGLVRRFRQIVPFLKRFVKSRKTIPSLIDFLKLPSETYLTYQFALAPFVRDIMGIYAALADFQAQIQNLISRSGKTQTHHFQWTWNEFPEKLVELSSEQGLDQPISVIDDPAFVWRQERTTLTAVSEFHAEIQYNYNYTKFQETHASTLALLDRLGVNFNTQIVWNALPWSFVCDWVIDVSQFLGYYGKVQNMEPTINILQYLWSIKRKRFVRVDMIVDTVSSYLTDSPYTKGSRVPYPVVTETAYRRQVGLPGESSITTSGLSPKEFSLGAALAICQSRYRGARRLSAPRPGLR
jgi:hypothetical protein